ncbi:glutaredoxin family protein [Marinihelvus fidelis]|uniref:Glutaredoxin family protein n=1 Tax=Marinihelvus fidelis TaxID=2613842 RepID=A0A5N0T7L7_9GAMM|nr:glutaredoxin family protein [Marinihelvus fidelis]KAA9130494.1 glutaredoxin family protein [Marinihelvus fidelis]
MRYLLYTRPDCHLCDEAADLVAAVAPGLALQTVDIEDSIDLLDRYGTRIPVLAREAGGEELGWPFDAARLSGFLASTPG